MSGYLLNSYILGGEIARASPSVEALTKDVSVNVSTTNQQKNTVHTHPASANKLFVFVRSTDNNSDLTFSVSYNSQPLTSLYSSISNVGAGDYRKIEVFVLDNPPTGTFTGTVTVTNGVTPQTHMMYVSVANAGAYGSFVEVAEYDGTIGPWQTNLTIPSAERDLVLRYTTWRNSAADITSSTATTIDDENIINASDGQVQSSRTALTYFIAGSNSTSNTFVSWDSNNGGVLAFGFTIKPLITSTGPYSYTALFDPLELGRAKLTIPSKNTNPEGWDQVTMDVRRPNGDVYAYSAYVVEQGYTGDQYYTFQNPAPAARFGGKHLRLEVRAGDDPYQTNTSPRSQFQQAVNGAEYGTITWYGFSTYIPSVCGTNPWPNDRSVSIWRLLADPDVFGGVWINAIINSQGSWNLILTQQAEGASYELNGYGTTSNYTLEYDVWTDWAIEIKPDSFNGICNVYKNGQLIARYSGPFQNRTGTEIMTSGTMNLILSVANITPPYPIFAYFDQVRQIRAIDGGSLQAVTPPITEISNTDADFIIPANVSVWDASQNQTDTRGFSRRPTAGSIVELSGGNSYIVSTGGVRGQLTIKNIQGTIDNPITIRGPIDQQITVRSETVMNGGAVLDFNSCQHFILTGYTNSELETLVRSPDGVLRTIKITKALTASTSVKDAPEAFIKFSGEAANGFSLTRDCEIEYVEIDGGWNSNSSLSVASEGVGILTNDEAFTANGNFSNNRQENIKIQQCYIANTSNHAIEAGEAVSAINLIPLRNIEISYNRINNCGYRGCSLRAAFQGNNSIHHNVITKVGLNTAQTAQFSHQGIRIGSSLVDVYNNWVEDSGEYGILWSADAVAPNDYSIYGTLEINIYNNVVVRAGRNQPLIPTASTYDGIRISINESDLTKTVLPYSKIYNNTVFESFGRGIRVSTAGIDVNSFVNNCISLNNFLTDIVVTVGTSNNNISDGDYTLYFVNPTGSYPNSNYRLKQAQPAIGTLGVNIALNDYEGSARTAQTADVGAYEFNLLNLDEYYSGDWLTTDGVVTGWDWTYKPSMEPAEISGMWRFGNQTTWPNGFKGKRLRDIQLKWRDLEPSPGVYNLSLLNQISFSLLGSEWDGAILHVRGAVKTANASTTHQQTVTAPDWLASVTPAIPVINSIDSVTGEPFQYYDISHPSYTNRLRLLIDAITAYRIDNYTVPNHPNLTGQFIHGVSTSLGEESSAVKTLSNPAAFVSQIVAYWVFKYGSNAKKLAWVGEGRPWDLTKSIIDAGSGTRGGETEIWLDRRFTPTENDLDTGVLVESGNILEQYYDASNTALTNEGYLTVVEDDVRIAESRFFGDELENFRQRDYEVRKVWSRNLADWPRHFRMAWLRVLQRRRNIVTTDFPSSWVDTNIPGSQNGFINAPLLKWAAVNLGKRLVSTNPSNVTDEAWVCFMKSYTRSTNNLTNRYGTITIHNLERWAKQRESWGATEVLFKQDHGFDASDANLALELQHMFVARKGTTASGIGLTVDRGFISGSQPVIVKVTYVDATSGSWSLEYKTATGTVKTKTVNHSASNQVKTATLYINDFAALLNNAPDIRLKSSVGTPFMFVRFIKYEDTPVEEGYQFPPGDLIPSTATLTAVPTFHSIGLYWNDSTGSGNAFNSVFGANETNEALVRFRPVGTSRWRQGLSLWFDDRTAPWINFGSKEYRGSLVELEPNTLYEIQVLTRNSRRFATTTVRTWNENFAVSQTITVGSRNTTYNVTTSGSTNGYVLYDFTGSTINGNNNISNGILIDASYVIIRGAIIRNVLDWGINISSNSHHVVIENCDISAYGQEDPNDTGFGWAKPMTGGIGTFVNQQYENPNVTHLVIQNNVIHDPRFDANSWAEPRGSYYSTQPDGTSHPRGSQAIDLRNTGGNHVIRYNNIYSTIDKMHNDCIGGGQNFSKTSGNVNKDTDIYGNIVSYCWDDALEIEGTNQNIRIWNNLIKKMFVGTALSRTAVGPVYIWRNVYTEGVENSTDTSGGGRFLKIDTSLSSTFGGGRVYVMHNTVGYMTNENGNAVTPYDNDPNSDGVKGQFNITESDDFANLHLRNNILRTRNGISNETPPSTAYSNWGYDLFYNGARTPQAAIEINGIQDYPVFDGSTTSGPYALSTSSRGYNEAVYIPNFNDQYTSPDIGAQERGQPALQFGIKSRILFGLLHTIDFDTGSIQADSIIIPSVPNLTAAPVSSTQINLSWNNSTDDTGIAFYSIRRSLNNSTWEILQNNLLGTSYQDINLQASTTYYYQIRATDTENNTSAWGSSISATTPAVSTNLPPSVPTGITATANSSTQVTITWSPSSDPDGTVASYRVRRSIDNINWTTIITGLTSTSYTNTSLAPDTLYYYQVRSVDNLALASNWSASVSVRTQSDQVLEYNPPFPRLGGRMLLVDREPDAEFYEDTARIAKFHVWNSSRFPGHSWVNGQYTMANIMPYIRSVDSPYPGYKTIAAVYTNPVQTGTNVNQFINKAFSESGVGGNRDWVLRYAGTPVYNADPKIYTGWNQNTSNPQPSIEAGKSVGGSQDSPPYNKFRPNPNLATTPDSSSVAPFTSGMRWHQWFARWWASPSSERTANLGDWTHSGPGIMEPGSEWDAVYSDEVNLGDNFSNPGTADWDDDGVNESRTSAEITTIIKNYHIAYREAWQTLFNHYNRNDMMFFANLISLSQPSQPWYTNPDFIDKYNGGIVERVSGYEKAQGFGSYTAVATNGDTGTGFMGRYWRAMRYTKSPRLVMFENDAPQVTEQWAGTGAPQESYSVIHWARYYLCACLLDDGYYNVQNGGSDLVSGTPQAILGRVVWLDEYHGGDELNQKGWMGYPVLSTPPRAPYSNGVWVREFDNALVVINPYQNGQKTITLPSPGNGFKWRRLKGSQDSAVNTGVDQSLSLTIREHDGFILRRVAITTSQTFSSGYDETYYVPESDTNGWRTSSDTVTGWDWSYPPTATAAELSGVFRFTNTTDYPVGFKGKKIYKINADWIDLEPTQGNYDLSQLNVIDTMSSYWDGLQLDVRGIVKTGSTTYRVTAPTWLSGRGIQETVRDGNIFYNIAHIEYNTPHRLLIDAIANHTTPSGFKFPAHPKFFGQIVHGGGTGSAGEEEGWGFAATNADPQFYVDTVLRWATRYGVNRYKLSYVGGSPSSPEAMNYTRPLLDAGMGTRNGIIERWLQRILTPRLAGIYTSQASERYRDSSGNFVNNNHYLIHDPTDPRHINRVWFGDQNEEYKSDSTTSWGGLSKWQQTYRMSSLRVIQFGCNNVALEPKNSSLFSNSAVDGREGYLNPCLYRWLGVQLGKKPYSASLPSNTEADQAWCCLMRVWTRSYWDPIAPAGEVGGTYASPSDSGTETISAVHNFERFLTQREIDGATTPTLRVNHNFNPGGLDSAITTNPELNDMDIARTSSNMGLRLDDRMRFNGNVAIKITFFDNNANTWQLQYTTSTGTATLNHTNTNTNRVKTRTWFVSNFANTTNAVNIRLIDGNTTKTPFMFVRIIKV